MTPESQSRPLLHAHCDAFDALRGVAALIVVIFHMNTCGFGLVGYEWTLAGQLGVNLFFTLSGFLIARSVLLPGGWDLKRYFNSRARRILPNFYIAVMLVLLFVNLGPALTTTGWKFTGNLAAHLTLLHGWFADYRTSIMGPFWTLSHEWCFYVFMGLAAPWFRGKWGWTLPATMLIIAITFRALNHSSTLQLPAGYKNPLCQWDQFAAGMFAALFLFKRASLPKWVPYAIGIFGLGLAIAMLSKYVGKSLEAAQTTDSFIEHAKAFSRSFWRRKSNALYFEFFLSLGFTGILAALWTLPQSASRWMRKTPLLWMGKVSYSTYLYHVPIILTFMSGMKKLESGSMLSNPTANFFIIIVCTYLFSAFAYHSFEKPWLHKAKAPS